MQLPYELLIGWRYTRAGKSARRNGFISFISGVSMLGIALGVAALIIVLSVMNGFQKEVRDRMLGVLSHIEVVAYGADSLPEPEAMLTVLRQRPEVAGAAPFVGAQGLIARGDDMKGVLLRGIDPAQEAAVTPLARQLAERVFPKLVPGEFGIVLGSALARSLGVTVGDQVTLIVPSGQLTPAGMVPRLRQMAVVGLFDSGHFEYDSTLAMLHIQDAQTLFRLEGPTGLRVQLHDLHDAPAQAIALQQILGDGVSVYPWTRQNRNWFAAVQLEKRMMFIILALIVAVAAFNLVSTLVMTVTDKRADIAILRTLGASPGSIMGIFMVQGATSGILGTALGLGVGLLVAFNISHWIPYLERLLGFQFLPQDIYLISRLPSEPMASDIWPIVLISLVLSFVATVYPSWSASRVQPAEALRYE